MLVSSPKNILSVWIAELDLELYYNKFPDFQVFFGQDKTNFYNSLCEILRNYSIDYSPARSK